MKNQLYYEAPASAWEKGMAVGNGRIGAMLSGGMAEEHIWLNEDTLWSGYPRDYNDPDVYLYLEKVRRLIFDKEYEKAEKILNRRMTGCWNESYLPMGDLYIETPQLKNVKDYKRILDLSTGTATVRVVTESFSYERTCFCSYPDQVLALRIRSSESLEEGMKFRLSSQLRSFCKRDRDSFVLTGWCPTLAEPDYYPGDYPILYEDYETTSAIRFQMRMKVVTDGTATVEEDGIRVTGSRETVLLLTSANSFLGYNVKPEGEFEEKVKQYIEQAGRFSWKELYNRHRCDFSALFDRVELELGHSENEKLPMEERLLKFSEGEEDPELIATAFQFGRYLLISSSREGTEPANLQGIWNKDIRPPWSSNYTVNINTQMNYWPAEVCNLPECAGPLMKFIEEIREAGKETARINYHCRGLVVHHNVDLWRKTTAVGSREKEVDVLPWSFWLMSGGWFCQHVFDHYAYNHDKDFLLETAWPVLMDCAMFYLDWLVEREGELITVPSTSPENLFVDKGGYHGVTYSCTLDNAILRELFENCLKMEGYVEKYRSLTMEEDSFSREVKEALLKLPPYKIGKYGQLQEWYEDFEEKDPEHRHLSLLYGLYPGNTITAENTPKLAAACRTTLKRRGEGSVPWSRAWKICLQARLKDGEKAYEEVRRFLQPADSNEISYDDGGIYSSLFCARPLEVDGNLGFTAGIAEMLLQSGPDGLQLLPALPKAWKCGHVKGLKVRGGQTADIYWEDGKLKSYATYCSHATVPRGVSACYWTRSEQ